MKEDLKNAFAVSLRVWPLIVATSLLLSSIVWSGVPELVKVFSVLSGVFLQVVLFGRLAEAVAGSEKSSAWSLFKHNILRLIVVGLLLNIPSWAFAFAARSLEADALAALVAGYGLEALVAVASIYAYPFVFLRGLGASAIPASVSFLLEHPGRSVHLVMLTVLVIAVGIVTTFVDFGDFLPVMLVFGGIPLIWLDAVIFAAACEKLIWADGETSDAALLA